MQSPERTFLVLIGERCRARSEYALRRPLYFGGSPATIPAARMSSRAFPRSVGKRREKNPAPIRQTTPPMPTVEGAPIFSATTPERSDPIGAIPMNIIE